METHIHPLDEILNQFKITNNDLVEASQEQLTYKQIRKARLGKPMTSNIQGKITRALNCCLLAQGDQACEKRAYTQKELFHKKRESLL